MTGYIIPDLGAAYWHLDLQVGELGVLRFISACSWVHVYQIFEYIFTRHKFIS